MKVHRFLNGGEDVIEKPILSLVVIRSQDIERLAEFYSIIGLHFEKHRHGSGPDHFSYESGMSVFEIYPRQGDDDSTTGARLGFHVLSVDSVVEKLEGAGARVISIPKDSPWGRRAVVEDPEGHRVELTESVEEIET